MFVRPEFTPETTPEVLTVATEVLTVLQAPPLTELPRPVVPAWHTLSVPVIGPGAPNTLTTGVTFAGVLIQPAGEVIVKLYTPVAAAVAGTNEVEGVVLVTI